MRDWNIHLGLVSFWDDEALMQRSVYIMTLQPNSL